MRKRNEQVDQVKRAWGEYNQIGSWKQRRPVKAEVWARKSQVRIDLGRS